MPYDVALQGNGMANPATRRVQPYLGVRSQSLSRRLPSRIPTKIVHNSRRKFLRYYPGGFSDPDYLGLERGYKWTAHEQWIRHLGEQQFRKLKNARDFSGIAQRAVAIEARTNLLFSFEKIAMRDAIKSAAGAKAFAVGLWNLLHGDAPVSERFHQWVAVLARLPRRQTRVLTWPLATVFGFIAQPRLHFFLKPMVTRRAAHKYGYDLGYQSKPDWFTYSGVLAFARSVRADIRDLHPRDMIDLQSYIWVQGSDEYPD